MDRNEKKVLREKYHLDVIASKLLRERGSRKVWYIRTNKGDYCFKRYSKKLHSYAFSFALQEYLMNKNSKIPPLILNNEQSYFSLDEDENVYTLFVWIDHEQVLDLSQPYDLKRSLATLASFHHDALAFTPPAEVKCHDRYRLNIDKEQEEITKLEDVTQKIQQKSKLTVHQLMIEKAHVVKENIRSLLMSGDLEEEANQRYVAHNDFAAINLVATNKKTYIIDLDDASYNFPTVDIEALYMKSCLKQLIEPQKIALWFQYYESVFPLSTPLKKLLIYRLQRPAIYRRLLHTRHLLDLVKWEQEKNKVLQGLLP